MSLATFVLRYLPPSPARVLELGCGPVGDLTYAIAAAGYASGAVAPVAPAGPLFRRLPCADFTAPGLFAAVVAWAMPHLADVPRTAERIMALLVPGGRFLLDEWDRARLRDAATARGSVPHRHAAAATGLRTGDGPLPPRYAEWRRSWRVAQGDRPGSAALRAQRMAPFRERFLRWRPDLYRYGLHASLEPLERALIEEGAIQATGFRWVGELDPPTQDG